MIHVRKDRLQAWATECLEKVGVPPPEAKLVAGSLVQTSVWGIDSHGVLRLTHYLRRLTIGSIKPAAVPVVTRTGPVTAQVHGEDGLGIVHAALGMETAIEMAKESGVGVVGVGHSSHCGAMGLYTRMAARERLVGIAMTHSSSVVVPHGGRAKYFGTNPISICFARANGEPVCLDMATSQVAWNKVLNARIEGRPLDEGIAVDAEGRPTTDANAARAGIPLGGPVYGYKGYGLAFMVDLLCGALNGMTFGRHINGMYDELDRPRKIGHFLMALDPGRFAGADSLEATVDAVVRDLRAHGEILHPGEPELIAERERLAHGIPIDDEALADMVEWSRRLGVVPLTENP
ncbi:MAG TPA: Ldh family oxidoreductase [Usitatibacter sp.]|jgi:ureidoglycolate dehydrogenase (NAD+)|nr:Ldh family oxidoreductase [Usitatibacter sp.]